MYIWFWQLMSQRKIVQSCLTYAKESLKKNWAHVHLCTCSIIEEKCWKGWHSVRKSAVYFQCQPDSNQNYSCGHLLCNAGSNFFFQKDPRNTNAIPLFILFKNHLVGGISTRIYLIPLSLQHPLGGINTTSKLLCWEHTADFPVLLCIDVDIAICKMSQCLAEISPCAESSKLTLTLQKFYNNPKSKVLQRTSWGITCFFH